MALFIDLHGPVQTAAIPPRHHMRGVAACPQSFDQRNSRWGFASTACVDIANTDHGHSGLDLRRATQPTGGQPTVKRPERRQKARHKPGRIRGGKPKRWCAHSAHQFIKTAADIGRNTVRHIRPARCNIPGGVRDLGGDIGGQKRFNNFAKIIAGPDQL